MKISEVKVIKEAAPTRFIPTHYGGIGGANNVMLHTDGNLYFQKQRDDGQPGTEIVRWNGNPTGEGILGRWNPATIKGTIVNGKRVPYPAGINFKNAPRTTAPAGGAAATPAGGAAATPAAGNGTLRKGSRGPAVRKLQLDLGVQPADGVFGPATEAAVKDFQQRMMPGEAADGIVGPKTNTAIQQSAAIDTGDNPEIEKSDPNSQFAALSGFATSRRGGIANNPSQVDAIKELQAELKRRGLLNGEVDGKYGPQTRAAVRAFQEQNDLYVDGDAGPKTIQKLMQRDDDITMTPLDDPQDRSEPGNGADTDNLDDQRRNPDNVNNRIQGALPQDIRDQYNQTLADKDYIAMQRLVNQYQYLYDKFAKIANPEGEGTLYDWLTAKAADDSSDFPGAEEPAANDQQQAPAGVAVGDVATQEQSDTLKAIDPNNYPMPGEELNQADVDALNDADQLAADAKSALDANPAPDQAQTTTEVDWEELDPNAAPEGYTLFIKRQETPVFTYGLEGGEPDDTEYATQREAIAAAEDAKEDAAEAPELEILDNQPRGYGMEQGKVIVRRGERYFEVDVSKRRNFDGKSRYRGSSLPRYEYDADDPQAPSTKNANAVYFDPANFEDVTTNGQNVEPRPTGSGQIQGYAKNDWDKKYGDTHNADGTPKANESVNTLNNNLNENIETSRILDLAGVKMKKKLNEASININGADASEVAEILRMMQLAGADGAKMVEPDDINPGPKPCPICGKMHGPSQPMGGCGSEPKEPEMGDMIRLMAPEEQMAQEDTDGNFADATTEPDAEYMGSNAGDVSDVIPSGNDLHKDKGSYPATAGGDNPMNVKDKDLEETIKSRLLTALAEKKSPAGGPACWTGKKIHPTKPTKMKGGKRVNNCIDADGSDGK